ncbi:autotransporter outer membrane beta-barrel domain-containing protein [Variovorax sp. M-6]|uniref:autotransporter outer membrane beta-barrel domain-containing protein n=1 Tax=Variovorax sp. M-6 TaxID=3233041 RepID=UPI003F9C3B9E
MNRSYRSVWNGALGAWVAVSEVAHGRGKIGSGGAARRLVPHAVLGLLVSVTGGMLPQAHAASYTASTEAELALAISQANASADAASTITLLNGFTIASPGTLPAATKALTISLGGFTLATTGNGNINAAAGATVTVDGKMTGLSRLTKDGAGTLILTGTGSSYVNRMVIGAGAVRVQNGGQITFGNGVGDAGLEVVGDNASATITGAGSWMDARTGPSRVSSVAGSSLNVLNGGEFRSTNQLVMGDTAGTTGRLRVDGTGSLVSVSGLTVSRGTGFIDVTAGGRIQSASFGIGGIGALSSQGGTGTVTVTGPGSRIDSGQTGVHGGTLTILDGGVVSTSWARIGTTAGRTASVTVSGSGSELISTAASTGISLEIARAGAGSLRLANGGKASLMAGTGAMKIASAAASTGTLSIGGALGQAAEAPGVLEAASVELSAGAGRVDFNHTDSSYSFAVPIIGTASSGVVSQSGPGTTVLAAANTYAGATRVTAGTMRAGAVGTLSSTSAYSVTSGGTLDLAGFSHSIASMANGGTVSLAGSAPGTTLTVKGPWVGNNGTLRLGTALGGSSSVSDRLILDGATAIATGKTTVQIVKLGGLGALTNGNGIEVISALNGATTTAQTTKDAFALAGGHVDAGAFEYRLHAADAGGAGENWYLRSTAIVVPPPTTPSIAAPSAPPIAVPMYRPEVPQFAALPEQLRQGNFVMLSNLHQRVGDESGAGAPRQAWGRAISTDRTVSQTGAVSPDSEGRLNGFQAGTDLWADPNWRAGVYVGQLEGDMSVTGFARGVAHLAVGRNDLRSRYLGAYATWRHEGGFYADAVLQGGRHRYDVSPQLALASHGKGDSLLASVEVGQSVQLAPGWALEPQLQLMHQRVDLDEVAIAGATVQQDSHNGWIARVGLRLKGEVTTAAGVLQPYGRLNVYSSSKGTDIARFIGPGGFADIGTRTGGTSTELAAGATLALSSTTSLYGELGKLWASGGDARASSGINASLGVKVRW